MLGNFLGALAGAGVISKGLAELPLFLEFKLDSMLAYLVGTLFSILAIIRMKKQIISLGGWISLAGVFVAALLYLVQIPKDTLADPLMAGVFFLLLCLYFTTVFVPRTFRSDVAANTGSNLAWVEFSYSLGGILGLIFWHFFPSYNFNTALTIGGGFLLLTAFVDFNYSRLRKSEVSAANPRVSPDINTNRSDRDRDKSIVRQYSFFVVILTLAVQVVSQRWSVVSESSWPYIAFMSGILLAPLLMKAAKIDLRNSGNGFIQAKLFIGDKQFASLYLMPLIASLLSVSALVTNQVFLIGFAAVLYEIFAILAFEAIALYDKKGGAVATTFGIMGVTAVTFYLGLTIFR